jgi:hypothetical protein
LKNFTPIPSHESLSFQFRGEFFNIFNHPQWADPKRDGQQRSIRQYPWHVGHQRRLPHYSARAEDDVLSYGFTRQGDSQPAIAQVVYEPASLNSSCAVLLARYWIAFRDKRGGIALFSVSGLSIDFYFLSP